MDKGSLKCQSSQRPGFGDSRFTQTDILQFYPWLPEGRAAVSSDGDPGTYAGATGDKPAHIRIRTSHTSTSEHADDSVNQSPPKIRQGHHRMLRLMSVARTARNVLLIACTIVCESCFNLWTW